MMYSQAYTRTVQFAGAAVLTTALAATAVGPMGQGLEHQKTKTAYQSVSVPALALTAVESTIQLAAASASTATVPSSSAAAQAAVTANNAIGDFFYDLARNVATLAALVLTPLWLVGAPITVPIGAVIGQALYPPERQTYWTAWLAAFAGPFLPIVLVATFFPARPVSSAAATAPAVRGTSARAAASSRTAIDIPIVPRDNASRQANVIPAAAISSRATARSTAAVRPSARSKAASVAGRVSGQELKP